jgi:hypothetical protein
VPIVRRERTAGAVPASGCLLVKAYLRSKVGIESRITAQLGARKSCVCRTAMSGQVRGCVCAVVGVSAPEGFPNSAGRRRLQWTWANPALATFRQLLPSARSRRASSRRKTRRRAPQARSLVLQHQLSACVRLTPGMGGRPYRRPGYTRRLGISQGLFQFPGV